MYANGNIKDIYDVLNGHYPQEFINTIVAYKAASEEITMHVGQIKEKERQRAQAASNRRK